MVLEASTVRYVQHQIARMDGGFDRGNCLYRIATGADLLTGAEPMDELYDTNLEAWVRQHVQVDLDRWIAEFRQQHCDGGGEVSDFSGLHSRAAGLFGDSEGRRSQVLRPHP